MAFASQPFHGSRVLYAEVVRSSSSKVIDGQQLRLGRGQERLLRAESDKSVTLDFTERDCVVP